jgi:hypothetical protein
VVLASAIFLLLQTSAPSDTIAGTVRDDMSEQGLAGVQVIEGGGLAATTDSLGRYVIPGLAAGTHQLRFNFTSYQALELRVVLPDSTSSTTVDVQLAALPVQLQTLETVATSSTHPQFGADAEIGEVRLDGDWLEQRQAGEMDADRALADAAGGKGQNESGVGLHVRGGGTSDNLVLLDGIPLYSAVHYSGASSAISPEVLGSAELHTGVSSARFGEHLAGVLELDTRDPGPAPLDARGSLGTQDVRQTIQAYLPALRTGIVVGGRTTYRNSLSGDGSEGSPNGYQDLLGVVTTQAAGGRLRLLSFVASNRLDFPSISDGSTDSRDVTTDQSEASPGLPRNAMSWDSHSQGLAWSRTGPSGTNIDAAAWWAGSSAQVRWLSTDGADQLHSDLSEIGLSVRATRPGPDGGLSGGVSLVRPSTRYSVAPIGGTSSATPPGLSLIAAPSVGSIFTERIWRPSRPLLLSLGLRASTNFRSWAGLEPRVTVILEPDDRTRVGLGVGRSHQQVQSVFNDASALGNLVGFDLPIAAGSGALPVARSDELEALAARRLGGGLDLSLTGYLRRTSGQALGAASTLGLFPADTILSGQGLASGVTGSLDLQHGRLWGHAGLTLARNTETAGSQRYAGSYGQGTSLRVDLGYRFPGDTRMLLRFSGGAGEPTSAIASGFEWQPLTSFGDAGELSGTPLNMPGSVNASRLADYARLDLGVRRSWRIPGFGSATLLTTSLSVTNVLGRANVLGLVSRPDGGLGVIRGVPRGLSLEVGWRF